MPKNVCEGFCDALNSQDTESLVSQLAAISSPTLVHGAVPFPRCSTGNSQEINPQMSSQSRLQPEHAAVDGCVGKWDHNDLLHDSVHPPRTFKGLKTSLRLPPKPTHSSKKSIGIEGRANYPVHFLPFSTNEPLTKNAAYRKEKTPESASRCKISGFHRFRDPSEKRETSEAGQVTGVKSTSHIFGSRIKSGQGTPQAENGPEVRPKRRVDEDGVSPSSYPFSVFHFVEREMCTPESNYDALWPFECGLLCPQQAPRGTSCTPSSLPSFPGSIFDKPGAALSRPDYRGNAAKNLMNGVPTAAHSAGDDELSLSQLVALHPMTKEEAEEMDRRRKQEEGCNKQWFPRPIERKRTKDQKEHLNSCAVSNDHPLSDDLDSVLRECKFIGVEDVVQAVMDSSIGPSDTGRTTLDREDEVSRSITTSEVGKPGHFISLLPSSAISANQSCTTPPLSGLKGMFVVVPITDRNSNHNGLLRDDISSKPFLSRSLRECGDDSAQPTPTTSRGGVYDPLEHKVLKNDFGCPPVPSCDTSVKAQLFCTPSAAESLPSSLRAKRSPTEKIRSFQSADQRLCLTFGRKGASPERCPSQDAVFILQRDKNEGLAPLVCKNFYSELGTVRELLLLASLPPEETFLTHENSATEIET